MREPTANHIVFNRENSLIRTWQKCLEAFFLDEFFSVTYLLVATGMGVIPLIRTEPGLILII